MLTVSDRYAHLRVVGAGDAFRPVREGEQLAEGLRAGELVHVLLDDGRVVESVLRADAAGPLVWVLGITGGYAHSRVRPVGGWESP